MTKILLVQGANMAWLGRRQPELYGTMTAAELDALVRGHAADHGYDLDIFYSHVEGEAIGHIYAAVEAGLDGLIMNPAGFTLNGTALADCVRGCAPLPYVEVHMTNIERRGMRSVLAGAADGVVTGFGPQSYLLGLDALLDLINKG